MLVVTLTMCERRHRSSIAGMSPKILCGDEEDWRIGLSLRCHHICLIMYYALCFVHVERSVCHEQISVLINTYIYK